MPAQRVPSSPRWPRLAQGAQTKLRGLKWEASRREAAIGLGMHQHPALGLADNQLAIAGGHYDKGGLFAISREQGVYCAW